MAAILNTGQYETTNQYIRTREFCGITRPVSRDFFWSWLARKHPQLLTGLSRKSVAAAGLNICGCLLQLKSWTLDLGSVPGAAIYVRQKYYLVPQMHHTSFSTSLTLMLSKSDV